MKSMTQIILALIMTTLVTACVPSPEPTTFVLTNEAEVEIYHDLQPGWLSLEVDGRPASLNRPSCMAECGALYRREIACAGAAIYPTVVELKPGEETVVEWDGVYYEIEGERECYRERRRGGELRAQFCYGYEYERFEGEEPSRSSNQIGGAWVENPVCELQTFERGGTIDLLAE